MSREQVVRGPLRVGVGSRRTLDQRLLLRFPRLFDSFSRLVGGLPPASRVRQAALWRGTRLAMEAFNRGDVDAAVNPGHPDFEMLAPRELVDVGFFEPCYRGQAGFRDYVSTWSEVFGFRIEPIELIDLGDRVVLLADLPVHAQASGVPFTGKIATVSEIRDGKATRVQTYLDHGEALAAVGLSE
jgi:ketosteroid isomerase-like protein